MPAIPPYKRVHTIGNVEVWKHPEGHRFVRFADASLQGHEIPHPKIIPRKDHTGVNFVTSFKTKVNGERQQVWAKEVGSSFDYQISREFRHAKRPFARYVHHARALRELRAAGERAPEPFGVLYPTTGRPLLLTSHVEGEPEDRYTKREAVEDRLREKGFDPHDLHENNVFTTPKGSAIIDASLFGPTRKRKFVRTVKKQRGKPIETSASKKELEQLQQERRAARRSFWGRILTRLQFWKRE